MVCHLAGIKASTFSLVWKPFQLRTISSQWRSSAFLAFHFAPVTFGWCFASRRQEDLIQPTASMQPGTHHGSHTDGAYKAVMYDYSLHPHTCTQTHTEYKAIRRVMHASSVHTTSCQEWCIVELMAESDAQAGASFVLVPNLSQNWTGKHPTERISTKTANSLRLARFSF